MSTRTVSARVREQWYQAAVALYRDPRRGDSTVACDVRRAPAVYPLHMAPCECGFIPNGTTMDTLAQAMIEHSLYHGALTAHTAVVS